MRMATLVISRSIGIVTTEWLENLYTTVQVHSRNTARMRFAIGDHVLTVRVKIVMSIRATDGSMIKPLLLAHGQIVPATKADCIVVLRAAVKINS